MSEAVEGALRASSAAPRPVGEAGFRDTMARFATGVTVVRSPTTETARPAVTSGRPDRRANGM